MNKDTFFDLLQKIEKATTDKIIIVGSSSAFITTKTVPSTLETTNDIDIKATNHEDEAIIEKKYGSESKYYQTNHLKIEIPPIELMFLPENFEQRIIHLKKNIYCMDLYDTATCKLWAGRDKDILFVVDLILAKEIEISKLANHIKKNAGSQKIERIEFNFSICKHLTGHEKKSEFKDITLSLLKQSEEERVSVERVKSVTLGTNKRPIKKSPTL